jgi:hypothetical protein
MGGNQPNDALKLEQQQHFNRNPKKVRACGSCWCKQYNKVRKCDMPPDCGECVTQPFSKVSSASPPKGHVHFDILA